MNKLRLRTVPIARDYGSIVGRLAEVEVEAECDGIREATEGEALHWKASDDDSSCAHCGQVQPTMWTHREEYWATKVNSCRFQR